MIEIIAFLIKFCLGEFKVGRNCLNMKKSENNKE